MPRFSRLATSTVAAAAVLLTAAGVAAADPPRPPAGAPEPTFPAQTAPTVTPDELPTLPVPASAPATWERLKARAGKDGTVRVIVGLNVRVRPEGKLNLTKRALQRETVGVRRAGMLRVLRGRRYSHVKDFSPVPFVAMHVSRDALDALQRSSDVANIAEDELLELEGGSEAAGVTSNENLNDWWDHYQTRTDTAWNNGYDGRGQTIGVLDTGTQADHPWLAGKVVREACYSVHHGRQLDRRLPERELRADRPRLGPAVHLPRRVRARNAHRGHGGGHQRRRAQGEHHRGAGLPPRPGQRQAADVVERPALGSQVRLRPARRPTRSPR